MYGGVYGKRHGELTFNFEIDEQDIADGIRGALLAVQGEIVASINHNGVRHIIGRCSFGGLNVKRSGDSVLKLDSSLEGLRLQIQALSDLADEYVTLRVVLV